MRAPAFVSGFSLIEVLVAMLIVGTGALAMVMLQLHALRSSQDSAQHARATLMALELAELRAALTPAPGMADPTLFVFDDSHVPTPQHAACDDAPCSAADFASAAIAEWSERLRRDFPGARVAVCRDGSETPQQGWSCDHDAAAPVLFRLAWRRSGTASAAALPMLTLVLSH